MQKIKTIQPYKLYAKLAEAKPSVKRSFIWGIIVIGSGLPPYLAGVPKA